MDVKSKVSGQCEYDTAGEISRWLFLWMYRLFRLGAKKELEMCDIRSCCCDDEPSKVTSILETEWCKELEKQGKSSSKYKPSLIKAIVRAFGKKYFVSNVVVIFGEMIKLAQPFMIGAIILYLQGSPNVTTSKARGATAAFILSNILVAITRHRGNILATRVGNNVRTAVTFMIMKKVLKVSMSSLTETDVGQIMNVLANDLNRFEDLSWYLAFVLCAPIMTIFVLIFTLIYLQEACAGGLIILIAFILFQGFMGRLFNLFRTKTARVTDQRVRLMSEIITAMKLIKVYCWEGPFAERVKFVRKDEIVFLRQTYILKGINNALFFVATRTMLFTSYLIRVLQGFPLEPFTTFVTMALYDSIRLPVTGFFAQAIGIGAETISACSRIRKILLMKEKELDEEVNTLLAKNKSTNGKGDPLPRLPGTIEVDNFSGRWTSKLPHDNLKNISFNVKPGELIIVIGSVGSGKSCLLYSLLKEIETTAGSINVHGDASYAPQEPWCFGGTVKENILLTNSSFDQVKYNRVVHACCLQRDLDLLPQADDTFIGEKGYSLSGGQKARVSLARCVYQDAWVYLMDDPLSAVDPRVANHIFNHCIKGYLKGKTVILVTHQLQFLPSADRILLLENGQIKSLATYAEMEKNGIDFGAVIASAKEESEKKEKKEKLRPAVSNSLREKVSHRPSIASSIGTESIADENSFEILDEEPAKQMPGDREEQRATGKLDPKIYWKYLSAGQIPFVLFFSAFAALGAQAMYQLNDAWLAAWSESQASLFNRANDLTNSSVNSSIDSSLNSSVSSSLNSSLNLPENPTHTSATAMAANLVLPSTTDNIILYCVLTLILFICGFLRAYFGFKVCLASSAAIHDLIFRKLLRAPISFYENNPLGRILNRITRDVGIIDQTIPMTLIDLISVGMQCVGVIGLTIAKQPWLTFAVVILTIIAVPIRNLYIQTARDLQRLDSLARSPVYNMVSSALTGLITVRSFKLQKHFEKTFDGLLMDSVACRFHVMCAQRAIGLALDLIAAIYILFVALAIMLAGSNESMSAADAGLILSSSLQIMGFFQFAIRTSADFETQMISCERVLEYSNLDSEGPLEINPIDARHKEWPKGGEIKFVSVNMWYSKTLPRVLKDVSFTIEPAEKVGIVGRTGAGKSSLLSVLFRLVELQLPSNPSDLSGGKVLIDDVDISIFGLHHLRSRISIIPQDPILFSGTIRSNLDPFSHYNDDKLWQVLKLSNLKTAVMAFGGLSAPVTEGGSNLSLGQRQLLCLARALLKNNRILVCDEATANVDKETDELIQKTIKDEFKHCTVLTIAHRLNTIIDMDKVLVLDAGYVVEFGQPYQLLCQNGHFASMVKQTGPEYEKTLISLAKLAQKEKMTKQSAS